MITTGALQQLPAQLRALSADCADQEEEQFQEAALLLDQAADVAEELLRLRQWKAAVVAELKEMRKMAWGVKLSKDSR